MTDDRTRAEELFTEATAMPTGMPRHEALERAARAADACDHDLLAATCRIALIDSCYWLNRYDLILAPIAWCRAAEQRDISIFSENEMHSLNWAYKWVPVGLRRDPRFSLAQIESVLDDLEARYKRLGYSLQPVHGQRVLTAAHIGDLALADEHFARFIATERDDMSDCAGCVVEEQVEHLVARGRYEEALRHAEPALAGTFTCSTQPQGVLTALLPALTALGEVERARDAHLTAYRRSREQAGQGYVGLHLEFCAVTGNVSRGMELLRQHLDQVHHATSPIGTMNFAASAALLLSRLDSPERVELALPTPGGGTKNVTAQQLRTLLQHSALTLAADFDRRNGTGRQTGRIQSILDSPDTVQVPLAVPNPLPPKEHRQVTADPVELAYQAHLAYEENDFLTGYQLLRSLPADLDPLLPANLAARLAARRIVVFDARAQSATVLEDMAAAVQRLTEVGEEDQAARFQARLGVLTAEAGDLDAGIEIASQALESAEAKSSSAGRILVRLILCELLDHRHEHDRASTLLDEALRLAEETEPERVPAVLLEAADHEARQRNLDAAEKLMVQVLAMPGLRAGDRFHGLRTRAAVAEVRGDVDLSLALSAELVEFVKQYPGPWVPDVLLHRATILDNLDRAGQHLAELAETVAACRTEGNAADIARACYLLSSGYLARDRLVEAAEVLEEALRLLSPDDGERLLPVWYRLATVCGELGEHTDAKKHFSAMLDLITEAPPTSQAMVWTGLGAVNYELDDPAEAERCHRRAAELWEQAELPVEACRAWIKTAAVLADTDPPAALHALEHAMAQIPPDSGELTDRLTAEILELRGYTYTQAGRYAESLADNMHATSLVAALGEPDWQIFLMVRASRAHLAMDAAQAAEQLAKESVTLLSEGTPPSIVARILDILTRALEAQGKVVHQDTTARALTARLRE
jgi:tetratricopeptide (TPR) repeat protein